MSGIDWEGVFPATTTQFRSDESLDLEATAIHLRHMIASGVDGIIVLGSLGENTVLTAEEKRAVMKMAVETSDGKVPVLSGVAEFSTASACQYARDAEMLGLDGLMVLPAMVYKSDPGETMAHFRAVARASSLPVMVYNNPVSYGVDVTPAMFAELADEPTLVAIKESSDNTRRITDIIIACGDRYSIFCGVDDLIVEAAVVGARGYVAGLVNAFPEDTVELWRMIRADQWEEVRQLYRWFMPLLHLDTDRKLVQYIKLAQAMVGLGSENVRAPRQIIAGQERVRIEAIIKTALEARPRLAAE